MIATSDDIPSPLALWSSRAALFAVQLIIVGLLLHRLSSFPTPVALNLFLLAAGIAVLAILLALVAFLVIWNRGGLGAGRATLALVLGLGILAIPLAALPDYLALPRINDISTDTANPPPFAAAAALRKGPANLPAYPGAPFAEKQAAAYPDIRPLNVGKPVEEVYEIALAVARGRTLHYQVLAERPPERGGRPGIIEAVDRTLVLGFPDDVVIRVQGNQASTRVDIRSSSRYGVHDLGRNAARVRAFLKELASKIEGGSPAEIRRRRGRASPQDASALKRGTARDRAKAGDRTAKGRAQSGARRGPEQKAQPRSQGARRAPDRQ